MCPHQFKFRNQFAVNLVKILLSGDGFKNNGLDVVEIAFHIADKVCERIEKDSAALKAEAEAKVKAQKEQFMNIDELFAAVEADLARYGIAAVKC